MRAGRSLICMVVLAGAVGRPAAGPPPDFSIDPDQGPPGTSVTVTGNAGPCFPDVPDIEAVLVPRLRTVRAQPEGPTVTVTFDGAQVGSQTVEGDRFSVSFEVPGESESGTTSVAASCDGVDLGSADFMVTPATTDPEPTDDPGPDPTPGPTDVPADPDPVSSSDWLLPLLVTIAVVIGALLVALVMQGRRGRAWVRAHVKVVAQRGAVGDEVRPIRSSDPAPAPTMAVRLEPRADQDQHVTLEERR